MKFSTIFLFASTVLGAHSTTSVESTTIDTITSCASTVSYCPGRNDTQSTITTYSDAAVYGAGSANLFAFGAAAAAVGAMLL